MVRVSFALIFKSRAHTKCELNEDYCAAENIILFAVCNTLYMWGSSERRAPEVLEASFICNNVQDGIFGSHDSLFLGVDISSSTETLNFISEANKLDCTGRKF
jgi:hypothetical protein